jgi:peptidyl-prolyl cis-trans isomerase A (cyclophilin A)
MKHLMLALGSAALIANAPAFAQAPAAAAHPNVLFHTSQGDIKVELYPEKAPKTVANFLAYVKSGQYSGTIFHRVIPDVGTIAMARTSDPNSATAQFFINTVDNAGLDYPNGDGNGYAVFGKVTSGMDVVKKIEGVPTTTRGPMADVPVTNVVIQSATVVAK